MPPRVRALVFVSVVIFWTISNSNIKFHFKDIEHDKHIKKIVLINRHIRSINQEEINNTTIRISFRVHDKNILPFRNRFTGECSFGPLEGEGGVRGREIPSALWRGGLYDIDDNRSDTHPLGVLDIGTTISTNLNILHIGDSVTQQIAGAMDEMLGAYELQSRKSIQLKNALKSPYFSSSAGYTVAPTYGGGVQFTWRVVKLLSKSLQDESRPGFHGAWQTDMAKEFLNLTYQWKGGNVAVRKMDACVFRVPHGWMRIDEITRERIIEAAELAHSLLRADTIIFLTVPFSNNVKTVEDLESVKQINIMIHEIANTWHLDHDTKMLILDYATYCDHIIWTNARHIGYNVSAPLEVSESVLHEEAPNFLLDRLLQTKWPPSIPMTCAKLPTNDSGRVYCDQNLLFRDGIHICPETLAARIGTGIACLLGCVYNRLPNDNYTQSIPDELKMRNMRSCELQCNRQFMSVVPIQESWVNSTLASFADLGFSI